MKKPYIYLEIVFYQMLAVALLISLVHLINSGYTSLLLRVYGLFQMLCILAFIFYQNNRGDIYVPRKIISYGIFSYIFILVISCFLGVIYGNSINYIVSSLFLLIVPALAFFAAYSTHDNMYLLDKIYEIANRVVPLYLGISLVGYFFFNFIGIGSPITLLIYVCSLDRVFKKSSPKNFLYFIMALVSMILGLKRAVIVSFALCFIAMIMIKPKRIMSLFLILPILLFAIPLLPDISYHFLARMESISSETKGFTSGQARESEVISILKHLDKTNSYIFGSGIGATYDYFDYRGGVLRNYHHSHVSFFGWLLRIGIVGAIILTGLYLSILVQVVLLLRNKKISNRYSALMIFVVISIIPMSFVSYNLTGNFITNYLAFSFLKLSENRRGPRLKRKSLEESLSKSRPSAQQSKK